MSVVYVVIVRISVVAAETKLKEVANRGVIPAQQVWSPVSIPIANEVSYER